MQDRYIYDVIAPDKGICEKRADGRMGRYTTILLYIICKFVHMRVGKSAIGMEMDRDGHAADYEM